LKLQTHQTGGRLRFLVVEQVAPDVGIPEERYAGEPGDDFLEEL